MTAGATIVVSSDLMDRSKVAAALPDAVVVRSAAAAVEVADDAALVIVDLRLVDPADLADRPAPSGGHRRPRGGAGDRVVGHGARRGRGRSRLC